MHTLSLAIALAAPLLGLSVAQDPLLASSYVPVDRVVRVDQPLALVSSASDELVPAWVRVSFSESHLTEGSALYIYNPRDGAIQRLDALNLERWGKTSAFFNGGNVDVSIVCPLKGGCLNSFVKVDALYEGTAVSPSLLIQNEEGDIGTLDLCERPYDRRLPSSDKRAGRYLGGGGCTGNLMEDGCFLTAEHCKQNADSSGVMQFQVPPSLDLGNGKYALQHPHPDDQYVADPESYQLSNKYWGNDWMYFGVFANSNTNKTPLEAQRDAFVLVDKQAQPPKANDIMQVIGYGVNTEGYDTGEDGGPVLTEWNQYQRSHVGFHRSNKFNYTASPQRLELFYEVDATGGNSGSAVIDVASGLVVGIHNTAGCTFSGNGGTWVNHPDLRKAVENPKGVCAAQRQQRSDDVSTSMI
jgi:V8-like Glu-specific endopeptidase